MARGFSGSIVPPAVTMSWKRLPRPLLPFGVEVMKAVLRPLSGLEIEGRIAFQVAAGSSKKANSSIQTSAEKPRTVSGLPGTAMMRLPFRKRMVAEDISAPGASRSSSTSLMATLKASAQSRHLSTASKLCRSDGLAIRRSVFGRSSARETARPAPVNDLPTWRPAIQAMNRDASS